MASAASENTSSFDHAASYESDTRILVSRLFMFIAKIDHDDVSVTDVAVKLFRSVGFSIESENICINHRRSKHGTAYAIVVDAPVDTLDVLSDKMKHVNNRLSNAYEAGKTYKTLLSGIKVFVHESNPLTSTPFINKHFFMVKPTTENLQLLGFNIEVIEKPTTSRSPKTFAAKTDDWTTVSHSAAAKSVDTVTIAPSVKNQSTLPGSGTVASVTVKPPTSSEASAKISVKEVHANSTLVGVHVVESDGEIIPLTPKHFKFFGANFVLVDNKPIVIGEKESGFYQIN